MMTRMRMTRISSVSLAADDSTSTVRCSCSSFLVHAMEIWPARGALLSFCVSMFGS